MGDINERIAELRGWFPPGSPEHKDRMSYEPLLSGRASYWLAPGPEKRLLPQPRYDSDWHAAGELLEECYHVHIAKMSDIDAAYTKWDVSVQLEFGTWSKSGRGETIPAAIAEAWLKAKEAEL